MTTARFNGREWTLHSGYRRAGWGWKSLVYWNPDWVAMNLDGIGSRLAWSGYALTERGIRRRTARALLRERRKHDDKEWFYAGKRRRAKAAT